MIHHSFYSKLGGIAEKETHPDDLLDIVVVKWIIRLFKFT